MSVTGLKIKVQNNPMLKKPYYALKHYNDRKIEENPSMTSRNSFMITFSVNRMSFIVPDEIPAPFLVKLLEAAGVTKNGYWRIA